MQITTTTPALQAFDVELDMAVARFMTADKWPVAHVALGFKTVIKNMSRSRMRVIFLAIDLDERVHSLVHAVTSAAAIRKIPVVFALSRHAIGRTLGLSGSVGCVAVYEEAPLTPFRLNVLSRIFVLAARARIEHLKHAVQLATLDVFHTYSSATGALRAVPVLSPTPRRIQDRSVTTALARFN